MAKNKLKIGVLLGGKSAEHEVSLQSARNVINALDKNKYEVIPIGIDKNGKWLMNTSSNYLLNENNPKLIKLSKSNQEVVLSAQSSGNLMDKSNLEVSRKLDVVFPVLHGPYGEDGSIQGFLKIAGIPCVGTGILGSAVGMDKDVMKRLLRESGIKIGKFLVVKREEKITFEKAKKELGIPIFIKPANMGSSVGVNKVKNKKDFKNAMIQALKYDNKIILEEMIIGRELECAVLGNNQPIASRVGEVVVNSEFYSYDAKYINDDDASTQIPAKNLPKNIEKKIREVAIKTFKTLLCEGMGRVDVFLTKNNEIYVNEINTIPGFTDISMYPKLWEISGISKTKLLDKLVALALERHKREQRLIS